jgi:membrane-associated phospholipid phosphatase
MAASGGAASRRSLWLWTALTAGLGVAFLLDGPVMEAVRPLQGSQLYDVVNSTIRWVGTSRFEFAVLAMLVVLGAAFSRRLLRAGLWTLAAFAVSQMTAFVVKTIVHRPRPWVTAAPPEHWIDYARMHELQSFPSADSTSVFAIAATLACFFPRTRLPLLLIAVLVAAERVVLGDHYPSDVWGGAMLGLAVSEWVTRLARRGRGASAETLSSAS